MRVRGAIFATIGAGLVLSGCGGGAAVRAPSIRAVPPDNGTQRCTEVYCVPQAVPQVVPRGSAKGLTPIAPLVPPDNGTQRCTEIYCVPQAVPRALRTTS